MREFSLKVFRQDRVGNRPQSFWDGLLDRACAWDEMIVEFNAKSGAAAKLS